MAQKTCFEDIYRSLVVKECVNAMLSQIAEQSEEVKSKSSQESQELKITSHSQPVETIPREENKQNGQEDDDSKSLRSYRQTRNSHRRKSSLLTQRMKGTSPILKLLEPRSQNTSEQKHFFFKDYSKELQEQRQKLKFKPKIKLSSEKSIKEGEPEEEVKKQEINGNKQGNKEEQEARVSRFTFGLQDDRRVIINSYYDNASSRTTSKFGVERKTRSQPKTLERKALRTPERKTPQDTRHCRTSVIPSSKRVTTTSMSPISRKLQFRERARSKIDTGLRKTEKKK